MDLLNKKRCILLNLWRFHSKQKEVISVYLKYLNHENADLRFNALVLLGSITEAKDYVSVYSRCLRDKDTRIRALALKELNEANRDDLLGFKDEIEAMTV